MAEERAKLAKQRHLGRDAPTLLQRLTLPHVVPASEESHVIEVGVVQHRYPFRADQAYPTARLGGERRDRERVPWAFAQKCGKVCQPPGGPRADGAARDRHRTEDLERDSELVGYEDPHGVGVRMCLTESKPLRDETQDGAQLAGSSHVPERLDPRVITPLVHDEQAIACPARQAFCASDVHRQRLLDEHGYITDEELLDRLLVNGRWGRDDGPVDFGERLDPLRRDMRAGVGRVPSPIRGDVDDGDGATEVDEVAQDASAPATAADQRDVLN